MAPETKPTIQIACIISQIGEVQFTLSDQISVNTATKELTDRIPRERKPKHHEHKTVGRVAVLTMLAEDWHVMQKEFYQHELTESTPHTCN